MCFVVVFQPSVVFHIETVICFALHIIPGFYMEYYTGLKWVKRVFIIADFKFESAKKSLRKFC